MTEYRFNGEETLEGFIDIHVMHSDDHLHIMQGDCVIVIPKYISETFAGMIEAAGKTASSEYE